MSTDIDDDDGPSFPLTVRLAGWIWVLTGAAGALGTILGFPGGASGPGVCAVVFGGFFAWAFLSVGAWTIRGEAADTLRNGIGSVGISLFFLGAAALTATATRTGLPAAGLWAAEYIAIGLIGGSGSLLMLAGVLALIGRGQYRAWREVNAPTEETAPDATDENRPPENPELPNGDPGSESAP